MIRAPCYTSVLALLAFTTAPAAADEYDYSSSFDQGRFALHLGVSGDRRFGYDYIVVGGGASYYVYPGLAVGTRALRWLGDGPKGVIVEPYIRYVLHPLAFPVKPFVGVFYRHWFIDPPFGDIDAFGGRAGLSWPTGPFTLTLGYFYERVIGDCTDFCTGFFPEFTIAYTF